MLDRNDNRISLPACTEMIIRLFSFFNILNYTDFYVLFYVLDYNLILFDEFCRSNCFNFDCVEHHLAPVPFWYPRCPSDVPISVGLVCLFYVYFLTFWNYVMFHVHLVYFVPRHKFGHFSREPWFLLLENRITYQDLDASCALCYWSAIAFSHFRLAEKGNT